MFVTRHVQFEFEARICREVSEWKRENRTNTRAIIIADIVGICRCCRFFCLRKGFFMCAAVKFILCSQNLFFSSSCAFYIEVRVYIYISEKGAIEQACRAFYLLFYVSFSYPSHWHFSMLSEHARHIVCKVKIIITYSSHPDNVCKMHIFMCRCS